MFIHYVNYTYGYIAQSIKIYLDTYMYIYCSLYLIVMYKTLPLNVCVYNDTNFFIEKMNQQL